GEIRARMDAVRRRREIDYAGDPPMQLRERLLDLTAESKRFGPLSMLANTSAAVWHNMLEMVLAKAAPGKAQALASDLLSGSGNVVSAEHGYRLFDLAEKAAADPDARALLNKEPLGASDWTKLPAGSPFRTE